MEYLILLIYTLVLAVRWQEEPNFEKFKFAWLIICVYCIFLFGFRYRVGIDTLNYMYSYENMPTLFTLFDINIFEYRTAPFYTLINAFCRTITDSFYLLQIVVSIIFNSCLFFFLKKHAENPFLAFAVFFFMNGLYFNTEIMKESLAIGFFLLNIDNLFEHRWKRYYSLAVVSLMFHYSAIIVFFFPLCVKLKFNKYLALLILVFLLVSKQLAEIFLPMITFTAVANRLDEFSYMMESDQLNLNWIIGAMIQAILIPLCMLFISKKTDWKLGKYEFLICLSVLFGVGCVYFEIIFQRFTNYVALFYAICLADLFISKFVRLRYKYILAFLFISIYAFTYINKSRYNMWFPYHSILNEQKEPGRELIWFETFGKDE